MEVKFNLNHNIKVRLTELGIKVLKEKHEEDRDNVMENSTDGFDIGEFELKIDSEGYTSIQGWKLFESFGDYIGRLQPLVFSLDVIITECEPIEQEAERNE